MLVNVTDAMNDQPKARNVSLPVVSADPFAEVEVAL